MKLRAERPRVNTGDSHTSVVHHHPDSAMGPKEGFVDVAFTLPIAVWEKIQEVSRSTGAYTDEVVADGFKLLQGLRDKVAEINPPSAELGMIPDDFIGLATAYGVAAIKAAYERDEEISIPIAFHVAPKGMAPFFVEEETVRLVNELCAAANVDPSHHVGGYYHSELENSFDEDDAFSIGLASDLLNEWGPDGPLDPESPAYAERKAALQQIIDREIARRAEWENREINIHPDVVDAVSEMVEAKLRERQQEAAPSVEGGVR